MSTRNSTAIKGLRPLALDTELSEPEGRVLRRFRLVFSAVKAHFQQVQQTAGVGGTQLWALSVIGSNPGIGLNSLACTLDVHQTTASNLVRALVGAEMIAAEKNGPDRRAVQLRILPAGNRVLHQTPGPFAGALPEAVATLGAETLERLDHDLALLIVALHADELARGIPRA